MTIFTIYDQLAEVLVQAGADQILALKSSPEMQHRFELLVEKNQESGLQKEEKDELDHFIVLERLIRLAKIRAIAQAYTPS